VVVTTFLEGWRAQDVNIFFSLVIWFVHPLSITHFVPPEEYAYKTRYACVLGTQVDLGPRVLVTRILGTHTFLLINVPFVRVPTYLATTLPLWFQVNT
jgi:hypothetical protein